MQHITMFKLHFIRKKSTEDWKCNRKSMESLLMFLSLHKGKEALSFARYVNCHWWNFWGTRPGCGLDDGQLLIICQHTEVLPLWEQGRWLFTVNSRGIGSRSNLCHTMLLCARRFRGGNNTFIAGQQKDGIKLWRRPVTLWCFFPLLQCVIKVSRLLLLMSLKRLSPEEVKLTGSWKQYRADQRYSERCCCRCMGLTETGARTEHLRQRSWEADVFDEH